MIMDYSEFIDQCQEFILLSDELNDGWQIHEKEMAGVKNIYLKKETFVVDTMENVSRLLKAEYVVSFNQSYCVPTISFNFWNSNGTLLSLDDIRKLSRFSIHEKDYFSTVTQQEHSILFRPFYCVHPCHTDSILTCVKQKSKNLIVTFLSLVSPLIRLPMFLDYCKMI